MVHAVAVNAIRKSFRLQWVLPTSAAHQLEHELEFALRGLRDWRTSAVAAQWGRLGTLYLPPRPLAVHAASDTGAPIGQRSLFWIWKSASDEVCLPIQSFNSGIHITLSRWME
jgi:hypothetical protein